MLEKFLAIGFILIIIGEIKNIWPMTIIGLGLSLIIAIIIAVKELVTEED